MPARYYAVRETDSYSDAVLHSKRGCVDGPMRAAPRDVEGERCPDCTGAGGESKSDGDAEGEENGTAEAVGSGTGGDAEDAIESGVCPWCDDYEGEHVGQHASSSHPEEWAAYRDGDDTED